MQKNTIQFQSLDIESLKTRQDLKKPFVPTELAIVQINDDSKETIAESKANACLIAAAPDLLAACKEALKRVALLTPFTVEGCDPIMEKATDAVAAEADKTREQLRAAIAKADGNVQEMRAGSAGGINNEK